MNKDDVIERMTELQNDTDTEDAHEKADDLLCQFLSSLGHKDLVEEFEKIHKWYA